jgi:hypothetical protein
MRETMAVLGAALLGIGAVTWGETAHAQQQQIAPFFSGASDPSATANSHPDVGYGDERWRQTHLPAPTNALELKVGTGYTQGFGNAFPGVGMPSVAGAGIGANADIDYRINPRVSFGVGGQYQEFTSENNSAARGVNGNLGFTIHGTPFLRGDPWIRLGVGYRLLWSVDPVLPNGNTGNTVLVHGFELGDLKLGYDLRLSEGVAIAPTIGADLTLFTWEHSAGVSNTLASAQVATFVFAGIIGRFDAGPSTGGHQYATGSANRQLTSW